VPEYIKRTKAQGSSKIATTLRHRFMRGSAAACGALPVCVLTEASIHVCGLFMPMQLCTARTRLHALHQPGQGACTPACSHTQLKSAWESG
jgi:hypothetical protein